MKQSTQIDINELIQDDHNFNSGTPEGQRLMEKSFKELGAGRSILIDKDGRIIAGNKSQQAAIAAGIQKVRVIETTGDELISVKRTDLSLDSKEGRQMALADNLTTQINLSWDEAELRSVADLIEDFSPEEFGYQFKNPIEEKQAEEDNFDENKETIEPTCKIGDIWQLGNHRLMCGDSTKQEHINALMQGEKADLWLTDPPYNVNIENSKGEKILNDNLESSEFYTFLFSCFKATYDVLSEGCPFYVWFGSKEHINFESALKASGLQVRQELIWNKNHFILGRSHYQWKHEPCFYGWKGDTCKYFINSRIQSTVISDEQELDFSKMKKEEMRTLLEQIYAEKVPTTIINEKKPVKDDEHPTMKPVRLFGYQIQNSSKPGDIILDNFGGSGTTIVACEQLDRKARLMEYDPHYCDVIIARWEKLTGNKAIKLN